MVAVVGAEEVEVVEKVDAVGAEVVVEKVVIGTEEPFSCCETKALFGSVAFVYAWTYVERERSQNRFMYI